MDTHGKSREMPIARWVSEAQRGDNRKVGHMRVIVVVIGLVAAFFVGCASTHSKDPTAQQKIEGIGQSFTHTDEQIARAEKQLASFEKSIGDLRESAGKSESMRTKPAFDRALARLDERIQQTHLDLQQLKLVNDRGQSTYSRQLDDAAAQMKASSDQSQAE